MSGARHGAGCTCEVCFSRARAKLPGGPENGRGQNGQNGSAPVAVVRPADQRGARSSGGGQQSARRVELTPASEIRAVRVRWLWDQRIALRSVGVVAGEPGLGKSTLTNGHLAACISRGTLEGELHGHPRDVLVATAEDSWECVVKPRLIAAGADLGRVHRVRVATDDAAGLLTLPDDVSLLDAEVCRLRDAGRPVALLVIDPVGAFLSEATDSHKNASVRRALAPLAELAEREHLAVVVVAHLNKSESQKLVARISGSGAFGEAARSVLAFARHPEDPNGEKGAERVVVHAKSNWGRYAPTLTARVEGRLVDLDDGECAEVGLLVVTGESDIGPEDLGGSGTGEHEYAQDAEEAIGAALAAGARPATEVKSEVATALTCSRKTVQRAAARMRDREELTVEESGFPRSTTWALTEWTGPNGTRVHPGAVHTATTRMNTEDPGGSDPQAGHSPEGVQVDDEVSAAATPQNAIDDDWGGA